MTKRTLLFLLAGFILFSGASNVDALRQASESVSEDEIKEMIIEDRIEKEEIVKERKKTVQQPVKLEKKVQKQVEKVKSVSVPRAESAKAPYLFRRFIITMLLIVLLGVALFVIRRARAANNRD